MCSAGRGRCECRKARSGSDFCTRRAGDAAPGETMEEGVDFFGWHGFALTDPPVEQGEESAGEGVGDGFEFCSGQDDASQGEALLDGSGKAAGAELSNVGTSTRSVDS